MRIFIHAPPEYLKTLIVTLKERPKQRSNSLHDKEYGVFGRDSWHGAAIGGQLLGWQCRMRIGWATSEAGWGP